MGNNSIASVRKYVCAVQAAVTALRIRPRTAYRYPFDHIALEIISKSFSIAEACLLLIEANHQDEAYGLCRSAVECALILRSLTIDRDKLGCRSSEFVAYSLHYKNFWLYHVQERFAGTPQSIAIDEEVKRWNLTANPDTVRSWAKVNTWKVAHLKHPLDSDDSTENRKSLYYAINYFQPSQYVHCSQPALDGFVPDGGIPFSPTPGRALLHDVPARICLILLTHLHQSICYALFGMNVERPDAIGELFAQTLSVFKLSDTVQSLEAVPEQ
jgi:hypothetical protein